MKTLAGNNAYKAIGKENIQEHLHCSFGEIYIYSAASPDTSGNSEDALAVFTTGHEHSGVLVVADGMGGAPLGQKAAELIVSRIDTQLKNLPEENQDLRIPILDGIDSANKAVSNLKVGAGSTCAVAEISKQAIRTYHVGDSSILVVGQRGKILYQTIAHSPVGYALEAGQLAEKEALAHEDLHQISNNVGDSEMRIEMGPLLKLKRFDTVLLATDGVFDNAFSDEICQCICSGPLEKAAQSLIALIRSRMENEDDALPSKADDASFILFRRNS